MENPEKEKLEDEAFRVALVVEKMEKELIKLRDQRNKLFKQLLDFDGQEGTEA